MTQNKEMDGGRVYDIQVIDISAVDLCDKVASSFIRNEILDIYALIETYTWESQLQYTKVADISSNRTHWGLLSGSVN